MEKIISDFLDIVKFKFRDLNNYNYPIYVLLTIFILFVFLDTALSSQVLSLGSNYKLIIIVFIKNFCQLFFVNLVLLRKINRGFSLDKFKQLSGFILLTYLIVIPAMFLILLLNNSNSIIISNIFFIIYFFSYLVFFMGIRFFININIFSLVLNLILGYLIIPMLFLNLLTIVSVKSGIISYDEVKIMGVSIGEFENKLKVLYEDRAK